MNDDRRDYRIDFPLVSKLIGYQKRSKGMPKDTFIFWEPKSALPFESRHTQSGGVGRS